MSNPWKKYTITLGDETGAYEARKANDGDAAAFDKPMTIGIGTNLDPALYPRQISVREQDGLTYAEPVSEPEAKNTGFRFVVKGPVPPYVVYAIFLSMQGPKD